MSCDSSTVYSACQALCFIFLIAFPEINQSNTWSEASGTRKTVHLVGSLRAAGRPCLNSPLCDPGTAHSSSKSFLKKVKRTQLPSRSSSFSSSLAQPFPEHGFQRIPDGTCRDWTEKASRISRLSQELEMAQVCAIRRFYFFFLLKFFIAFA